MKINYTMPLSFWTKFFAEHWQEKPLLLKQPFAKPLVNGAEVFESLVEASRRFRDMKLNLPIEFYDEKGLELRGEQLTNHLPMFDDTDVYDYAERVTRQLGGQRFAFVLNGFFFAHHPDLWFRARSFFYDLLQLVPNQSWCSAAFVGNYNTTPFGVHRDDKSTFQIVVAGQKRMLLWSNEFVEKHPELRGAHDYEKFLDDAITLEAEAGDLMFWNQSYWHTGESSKGLSIGLSIGFYESEEPKDELKKLVQKTSLRTYEFPMPADWQKLNDDDVVRADSRFPIAYFFAEDFRVVVSANGHTFPFLADERIVRLFELLNTGEAFVVEDLLTEFSGVANYDDVEFEIEPEGLRALLERLLSLRAIERCKDEIPTGAIFQNALLQNGLTTAVV